ncbi:hypothetical protein GGX14DRAFT_547119, partial [Mycena pura]
MSSQLPSFQRHALDFNLSSYRDRFEHHEKVMRARALATKTPLESGLQFTMDMEIPQQNSNSHSRLVPIVAPTSHVRNSTVSLRLLDPLQPGINMYSQVWAAAPIDVPDTRLVLKIIQPSMCRCPEPDDSWGWEYADPWDLAHKEAWVYRNLAHIQGLVIPYFFGLHTIITPSQETAWVLVLEFIPGPTGDVILRSKSMPMLQNFCRLGMAAAHGLARGGWALTDIRAPN